MEFRSAPLTRSHFALRKKQETPPTVSGRIDASIDVFAKMYAKDYGVEPFYFTQTSARGKVRVACWSCNPHYTWDIAEQVLSEFPSQVDVLLKVEAEEGKDTDPWERYHRAGVNKQLVLSTVRKYEDYVLGDASNEIAIRRSDTGEYLAYDCGGVLWLYPDDDGTGWCGYIAARGIQLEYRTLITDVFHWSRSASDASNQRNGLLLDLGLEPVERSYQ
jgi:hypothetical protein